MLIAILSRIILFVSHPSGLNQDEASIGYESWSLLNYGIDRNGYTYPVHLVAWGSGQNVLYAYLCMPFISLFGLNVFSVRIVNLIFSLVTVIISYFTVSHFKNKQTGFIAMTLMACSPWNIMLARWGLESNLFPALFMLSIYAILKSTSKSYFIYISAFFLAISLYSYGSAYLVISIFALSCFIYLFIFKLVSRKHLFISAIIFFIISAPIYVFVIINVFQLEGFQIGMISIPKLFGNRIESQSGASLYSSVSNLFKNIIFQTDNCSHRNSLTFFGCFYVISLPFWIHGIYTCVRKRKRFDIIILLSLISSVLLFGYYNSPNINRVNAIYIPLILLTSVGLSEFITNKSTLISYMTAYAICFTTFCSVYFGTNYRQDIGKEFFAGLGEAIIQADKLAKKTQTVYITQDVNAPYIYTLFYTQTPPQEFMATVQYQNAGDMFQNVDSFSNYIFNTDGFKQSKKGIYVIETQKLEENSCYFSKYYQYGFFSVVVIE